MEASTSEFDNMAIDMQGSEEKSKHMAELKSNNFSQFKHYIDSHVASNNGRLKGKGKATSIHQNVNKSQKKMTEIMGIKHQRQISSGQQYDD